MTDKRPARIQLCGRLAVESAGHDLTPKLPGGQARVLFTYLTVNRALPSRRDEMIEALWPWRAPAGADASLSALLSRLRSVLGADVLCGRGEIRLQLPPDAWIDLEAAEEAIHRAEAAVAQADWARGWGPSLIALFTARRGFLPGEDLPWAEEHRRRLEEIRVAALESYAAVALGIGGSELPPGERSARELVLAAPYREAPTAYSCRYSPPAAMAPRHCASMKPSASGYATSSAPRPDQNSATSRRSYYDGETAAREGERQCSNARAAAARCGARRTAAR